MSAIARRATSAAQTVRRRAGLATAAVLALFMLLPATPVQAGVPPFATNMCAADRYGADLGCTAGDVSITGLKVVGDTTSCVGGTNITLDLEISVNFAVPNRWDIGIFISNDGNDPQIMAANGGAASCSVSVLPNTSPFLDLDPGPHAGVTDTCGDGNSSIGGGTGNGIMYMNDVTVPCQSLAGAGGKLYIPFVVSWDNNKSPTGNTCTSNAYPVPNTKSKCNSPTILQGSVDVVVMPTISITDGTDFISNGATTNYSIVITNTTGVALTNVVFQDPAVTNLTANSVTCAVTGGATCPATSTVAAMQGTGLTIPSMPANSTVTFTVNATLTGSPNDTITNTASVTSGTQTNYASDTDTIADVIAISPSAQSKNAGLGTSTTYTYTLYNFGPTVDTISLAAVSSQGWTTSLSASSISVAAGGSSTFTLTVTVPAGATLGTLDTTTITATSGVTPANTATATANTTASASLTLTPDNTGAGGKGSSVYYNHTVANNSSGALAVTFANSAAGACTGWTYGVYLSDQVTPAGTLNLASGTSQNVVVKVTVPSLATTLINDVCTVTTTATSGALSASVTDATTVKSLILYSDGSYTDERYVFPEGNRVYAKVYGLTAATTTYYFRWYNPSGTLMNQTSTCQESSSTTPAGTSAPNSYYFDNIVGGTCAETEPFGKWTLKVCTDPACPTGTVFATADFYVGPDHLQASYTGTDPETGTNTTVSLSLHDRYNHVVPTDSTGALVAGLPPTTEDPLKITVTVSGSATIVSSTLRGDDGIAGSATISGQTVTGRLDPATGTATITISNTTVETVTVTPATYNSALAGSPGRDETASVTFTAPALNHIRIEHTGTGMTCVPSTVTVKACADASCTTLATTSATVTLSPAGVWGTNPITFTGSTTASISITSPQTVTLGTSAVSPTPTAATKCFIGATEDCDLVFSDAGFIVSASTGGAEATIPAQTAGITSGTYYLRAVKKNTTTQACEAALTGATQVNFGYECNNPATCYGSDLMTVSGGASTVIARNDSGAVASYAPVNVTFDANGNAPFTFNYSDVGQVTLHAQKTVNGVSLTGASNAFVVKPDHFELSAIKCTTANSANCGAGALAMATPGDNPAAANQTGVSFIQAGKPFSVTVTAMNAVNSVTPSYGRESPAEAAKLTATLVSPTPASGGINGTLTSPTGFATFTNGVSTATDLSWDEVGVITLTPDVGDSDYLGAGNVTGTVSGNVGRFIPHRLGVASTVAPLLDDACAAGGFTYLDQWVGFGVLTPEVTVTGLNTAGNATKNYDSAFWKLGTAWAGRSYGNDANTLAINQDTTAGSVAVTDSGNWDGDRVLTLTGDQIRHRKQTAVGAQAPSTAAFAADVSFTLAATDLTDTDGACYDSDTNGTCDTFSITGITGTELRDGRLALSNANGSELLDLAVPLRAEYFSANGFVTNTVDTCTALTLASDLQVRAAGGAWQAGNAGVAVGTMSTTATLANSPLVAGAAGLSLSAPGTGGTGFVDLQGNLAASFPWLQFDWDGNGTHDNNPSGRASFGIYGGSPRHIYLREIVR